MTFILEYVPDFTDYNQYDYLHFTNQREGKGGGKDEF